MTDLDDVIRLLRERRPEATPLELDRIKQRARRQAGGARRSQPMKSRLAIVSMLVGGLLLSFSGVGLAVGGGAGNNITAVSQYATATPTATGKVLGEQVTTPNSSGATTNAVAPATALQPARQQEQGAGSGSLPFTGFAAIPVLLGGLALLSAGLVLRRRTRDDS